MTSKINDQSKFLYLKAIDKWGKVSQIHMCSEEMSELNKELMKVLREGLSVERRRFLVDELADVTIMLEQMILCFNAEEEVSKVKQLKLERLCKLIEEE